MLTLTLLLLALPATVHSQLYLANITSPVAGLSATCIQVLNQPVDCDPLLLEIDASHYESDGTLAALCTSDCTTALSTYQRRVTGACGSGRYDGGDGWMYLAGYNAQIVVERFEGVCLKNGDGELCNSVIREQLNINTENQQATATPASSAFCNGCILSSLSNQLEQPLASESLVASIFTSLTSHCASSGFDVSTPATTTAWATPSSGAPDPSECLGTTYTVQGSDTCQSVSLAQGISTTALLKTNGLVAYCRNFPPAGATLCIPDAAKCAAYQLTPGEQCRDVASGNGVTWTQVVTWNLDVGRYCDGIDAISALDFVVCVSNPGGTWVDPTPGDEPSEEENTPRTTAIPPSHTLPVVTHTTLPTPTWASTLPNLGYQVPLANGTLNSCYHYASPPVAVDALNYTTTFACDQVAALYDVALADLMAWNPSLALPGNVDEDGNCALSSVARYCVQREKLVGEYMTSACVRETMAVPGWTCEDTLDLLGVKAERLGEWNPGVGDGCQNYVTGHVYCTAVRDFKPKGQISTCNTWHTATAEEVNGDNPCGQLEERYGLSHGRFVAWNPSLQNDCSGIVRNYAYCIGTPSFPTPKGTD